MAGEVHPVPFRTRKLSPLAPMVLRSSPWESRTSLTNEGHSVFRGRVQPGALGAAQRSESSDRRSPDRDFLCQGKEELGLLVQLG